MACKRAHVYRNLGIMLDAGVPILRALTTGAAGRDKISRGVHSLIDDVAKGDSLAAAMRKKPKVFDPLDVMLIESGETSGNLSETLGELGKWYEFRNTIKNNIRSGMTLPLVIFHAAAFVPPVIHYLMGMLVPGIPEMTVWGFILEVLMILQIVYIPAALILGIVYFTPRTGPLRVMLDKISLKIPILSKALRSLGFCRFCQSFSMLYNSGAPISNNIKMAAAVTGNQVIKKMFQDGEQCALDGRPVSEGFSPRLPVEFLESWVVGEETGKLYDTSKRLAKLYQDKAEFWFDQIANWLPKIFYAIVCGIIIVLYFKMFAQAFSSVGGML